MESQTLLKKLEWCKTGAKCQMLLYTLWGYIFSNSTAVLFLLFFSELPRLKSWDRGHEKKKTHWNRNWNRNLRRGRCVGFWQTSTNSFSLWGLWDVTAWQVETSGDMLPITLQEMKYGLSGTIHEGHHWPDAHRENCCVIADNTLSLTSNFCTSV